MMTKEYVTLDLRFESKAQAPSESCITKPVPNINSSSIISL